MSVHRYAGRPSVRRRILEGCPPEWLQKRVRRGYITRAILASPPWVCQRDFYPLVNARNERTRRTGVKHVLAHVVPLSHHNVCGLNVPWNVHVLTDYENSLESNVWYDEPDTLLPTFEQFRLFA